LKKPPLVPVCGISSDAAVCPAQGSSTFFLVDPRTRLVSPAELDRAATRLTSQLRAAFGKK
jgi:hypothetical protein